MQPFGAASQGKAGVALDASRASCEEALLLFATRRLLTRAATTHPT